MSTSSAQVESRKLALHLGISGFPVGSAAVNKCMAVYRSLYAQGIDFQIINNRAFHRIDSGLDLKRKGNYEGLEYLYTTPSPYKSNSFLGRRASDFMGRVSEFFILIKIGRKENMQVAFYYPTNGSFLELLYYRLLSKVFQFKIIAHYVEYRTSFDHSSHPFEFLADWLYDKYFMKFVDAVLPISEFLIKHLHSRGYDGPLLKVPPLADFSQFENVATNKEVKYFFYVGSASYKEAIELIVKSFEKIDSQNWELHLLVNGDAEQMTEFKKMVAFSNEAEKVKCFSNLSYPALIKKYMDASALLIPLNGSVQDTARFPQKMSEYLASGNPVVTTNFGEVPNYLQDGESALVSNFYTIESFAEKMKFAIQYQDAAIIIGKNGRQVGLKYFDFNSYGEQLKELINKI